MRSGNWYPVAPSHHLRPSDNIVAGFVRGQELALWRSKDGVVQVWENRCPHRGTRLTLGRIIEDRLSCAYHGWEFNANGGKCASIPAHPSAPAPKQLCVKAYTAVEADGMVWVCQGQFSDEAEFVGPESSATELTYVRSFGLRVTLNDVVRGLTVNGFTAFAPFTWKGVLGRHNATIFITEAGSGLSFAHAWLEKDASAAALAKALAAAIRLRGEIESLATRS